MNIITLSIILFIFVYWWRTTSPTQQVRLLPFFGPSA